MQRLYWYLIDGIPEWVLSKVLNWAIKGNNKLCLSGYRRYQLRPLFPNCQTPPSLFSIFSGKHSLCHKLFGFDNPTLHADSILEHNKSFENWPANISFIWDEYLSRAFNVSLSHIPFVSENDKRLNINLKYVNGFNGKILDPFVLDLNASGARWFESAGFFFKCFYLKNVIKTVILTRNEVIYQELMNVNIFYEVRIPGYIHTYVGVFEIEGVNKLLCLGYWDVDSSSKNSSGKIDRHPFFGKPLSKSYRNGELGKTLMNGGDGTAERLLQRSCILLMNRFEDDFMVDVISSRSQLIIGYQPAFDFFFHDVVGYLDNKMSYYTPERERIVLEMTGEMFEGLDRFIRRAHRLSVKPSLFIVSSDHGMEPIETIIYLNRFLCELKLIALNDRNGIEPDCSICFYHPAETGLLCFNRANIRLCGNSIQSIQERIITAVFNRCKVKLEIKCISQLITEKKYSEEYYVVPPSGIQLKADIDFEYFKRSQKTGDHAIFKDDQKLEGVILDLNDSIKYPSRHIETFEIKELLLNPSLC